MDNPTFIGPVLRERKTKSGGGFAIAYFFVVVQGDSYVVLTAATRDEASALRADYTKAGAEPVPTQRLLVAISDAIKLAGAKREPRRAA